MLRSLSSGLPADRLVQAALPLAVVVALLSPLAPAGRAAQPALSPLTSSGMPVDTAVYNIWYKADGPVASGEIARGWLWGPSAIGAGVEFYRESPIGLRSMAYFDKGRLDILNPRADPASEWYVSGALLVAEMLSGTIQFGQDTVAHHSPPDIAVVGDPGQPSTLTYAAIAPLASIAGHSLSGEPVAAATSAAGRPVQTLVTARGDLVPGAVTDQHVTVGAWDDTTDHNIAAPFADWAQRQTFSATWLLGRPLTEPLWVEATVAGTAKRVLFQAFERRVLTFTPDIPPAWQVESANVGRHYREWRGLAQPSDPALASLAAMEPFGEDIVTAAVARGADPFLLSAIARATSAGNPLAQQSNGGQGILAVRPDRLAGAGDPADPRVNAGLAADELARRGDAAADQRIILARYWAGDAADPAEPATAAFVEATLAAFEQLHARHPVDVSGMVPVVPADEQPIASGPAAYYSPGYSVAWWENMLATYAGWGQIVPGWQPDPLGYYCVRPGMTPGARLELRANGASITCTIGDTVRPEHVDAWLANWAIELNWPAFTALGLDHHNAVDLFRP